MAIFWKKMKIFGNFFGKNVKFLAIFWQSNGNFPEGQLKTTTLFVAPPQYAAIGNHSEKPPLYPDDDADSWVEAELDADTHTSHNIVSRGISAMQNGVKKVNKLVNKVSRGYFWSIVFLLAYFIYFFAAMVYE